MNAKHIERLLLLSGTLLLPACAVGPDYERPPVETPVTFKEQPKELSAEWKQAVPQDTADRGAWWKIFNDPKLDALEQQVEISNQNIKQMEAAYTASLSAVDAAQANLLPTVSVSGSMTRAKTQQSQKPATTSSPVAGASWEFDLWGKIRRQIESEEASAQASAADLAAVKLSTQASLAKNYFSLRAQDESQALLDATVSAYARALKIVQDKYKAGVASSADVANAKTQFETMRMQAAVVGQKRAQLEHAIAVLVGKAPADFSLSVAPLTQKVPMIPADVPSQLLERRPDIALAERQMAAANAQIGVAMAAYFPDVTLSASYGFAGSVVGQLMKVSNSIWSAGAAASETIFDFGKRGAQLDIARAGYDQSVANYRQTVLTAFQQVEDELVAQRFLAQEAENEKVATNAAHEAERLTLNQYKVGVAPYSSVIVAQVAALSNDQNELSVRQNRVLAAISMIEVLGGGWNAKQLED